MVLRRCLSGMFGILTTPESLVDGRLDPVRFVLIDFHSVERYCVLWLLELRIPAAQRSTGQETVKHPALACMGCS